MKKVGTSKKQRNKVRKSIKTGKEQGTFIFAFV